jgi:hypothetical protein
MLYRAESSAIPAPKYELTDCLIEPAEDLQLDKKETRKRVFRRAASDNARAKKHALLESCTKTRMSHAPPKPQAFRRCGAGGATLPPILANQPAVYPPQSL